MKRYALNERHEGEPWERYVERRKLVKKIQKEYREGRRVEAQPRNRFKGSKKARLAARRAAQ